MTLLYSRMGDPLVHDPHLVHFRLEGTRTQVSFNLDQGRVDVGTVLKHFGADTLYVKHGLERWDILQADEGGLSFARFQTGGLVDVRTALESGRTLRCSVEVIIDSSTI